VLLAMIVRGVWFDTWVAYILLAFLFTAFLIEIECVFCTDTRVGLHFIVRSPAKRERKSKLKVPLFYASCNLYFSAFSLKPQPSCRHPFGIGREPVYRSRGVLAVRCI
jgi:hypothetical protein